MVRSAVEVVQGLYIQSPVFTIARKLITTFLSSTFDKVILLDQIEIILGRIPA